MQTVGKKLMLIGLVILISCCMNGTVNAQTPADDPGIGGPGTTGSSPAGDGAPIVPFDGTMNLFLLASGVAFAAYSAKNKLVVSSCQ